MSALTPNSSTPLPFPLTLRSLYGGAISISIPPRFIDVSPFRDIPNHQEVFADADTDQSIIIEINQSLSSPDAQAAYEHMEELANVSSSHNLSIVSLTALPGSALPLLSPAASYAAMVVGEMSVSKYREGEEKANRLRVYMLMVRLQELATDVLVILNAPMRWGEGSVVEGKPIVGEEENERIMREIMGSLNIHDYQLFGPREEKMAE